MKMANLEPGLPEMIEALRLIRKAPTNYSYPTYFVFCEILATDIDLKRHTTL